MALYLPPASRRTSALIFQSSSFGAKMTRVVLRKRCAVRRSTTAVSQSASTSHLGKPNSTLMRIHLFLQECIPDSVQVALRFLKVRCWWVRTSPTLAHRTHTLPVLPFIATNEPAISTVAVDTWWLTAAFISQQPVHARSRPTGPICTPPGPGPTSASGLIDPCNLFCKNLDLDKLSSPTFGALAR